MPFLTRDLEKITGSPFGGADVKTEEDQGGRAHGRGAGIESREVRQLWANWIDNLIVRGEGRNGSSWAYLVPG